jgi:hypothetical protein
VTVYGASGHTGRFVVAELRRRGQVVVEAGRDASRLGPSGRAAAVDDPAALDRALQGSDAVVNTAGPFAATAGPVIEAALRAGIPYVDVAAEIEANVDTFERYGDVARAAGVLVLPAMAFFGGLGDLLATAALGDWAGADRVDVAYGLDSWHPTAGTRAAGQVSRQRRDGRRVRFAGNRLEYRSDAPPRQRWDFPAPIGGRDVIAEFSMADIVTVPSHLAVAEVRSYMTVEAAADLASPDTPAPVPAGADGRSAQSWVVDVVAHRGPDRRRAVARGRDIYAVSAPLAVEAVERILTGRTATVRAEEGGVASAGALFDAEAFLASLAPHVEVQGSRLPSRLFHPDQEWPGV